jgi:peptidoglycan/LPS O-acetylase OafA/YrhL
MKAVSDSSHPSLPRAVRIGWALFGAGLVFIALDVVPFFFGDHNRPLWLNLACLLAPLGFAVAIGSTLRRARQEQRSILREVTGT